MVTTTVLAVFFVPVFFVFVLRLFRVKPRCLAATPVREMAMEA